MAKKSSGKNSAGFLTQPAGERESYVSDLKKSDLMDMLLQVGLFFDQEKAECVAAHTMWQSRLCKERDGYEEERARHLQQAEEMADDNNRLRNENEKLQKMLYAAMDAREKHILVTQAAINAIGADVTLASYGLLREEE